MIAGYSLAHNQVFAPVFRDSLALRTRLKEMGIIENEDEVLIGQKCLLAKFQKSGIMERMDKVLYNELCLNYKYYMASIAKVNTSSLKYVINRGYKEVYSSDLRTYFLISLEHTPLTKDDEYVVAKDGAVIHFRFATLSDIPELTKLNNDFLKENLSDLSNGYLAAVFAPSDWEYMISRRWVVLGEYD